MADRWEEELLWAVDTERELRPKNHGVRRITAWPALLEACRTSQDLEVLYLQAQPTLDDDALRLLGEVLADNHRITGVNLGELPAVTDAGWAAFAAKLPETAVTDCYAQAPGGGPSARPLRALKDAVLANRARLGVGNRHKSMWRASDYRRK